MNVDAVLFDMDGVIINSRPEIEGFWQSWAQRFGFTIEANDMENHIHGCPARHTIAKLFGGITAEEVAAIETSALQIGGDPQARVMPGFFAFTDTLSRQGIPFGIVTSHPMASGKRIADALGLTSRLAVFVTADQVKNGKPHPEPYLLGCERLGLPPGNVLVFEDSVSGAMAAVAAGNMVVGINQPTAAAALLALGVLEVFPDFVSFCTGDMMLSGFQPVNRI